jgi:hypothetical protein
MRARRLVLMLAASTAVACREPTGTRDDVVRHRARWTARGITSYRYDYRLTGFFIAFAGKTIRIDVRAGAVQSATDAATGQAMPGPTTQWPTIERLFDQAESAAALGDLRGITYDPVLDYPTQIDVNGPPDASGSLFASGLVQLP